MDPKDILNRIDHSSGMTVPEGYFEAFNERMAQALPPIAFEQEQPKVLPKSLWQKVRPYVYMAAMFAGIWCMMKMFDIIRPTADLSIESHPEMTAAVNNDAFFNDYIVPTVDEQELLDDLYNEGFDTTQFEYDNE